MPMVSFCSSFIVIMHISTNLIQKMCSKFIFETSFQLTLFAVPL
jgi:hypothetical protein